MSISLRFEIVEKVPARSNRGGPPHGDAYYQAVKLRQDNPCLRLSDIGRKIGVSRQRIEQILRKEKLPTRGYRTTYSQICPQCKKTWNNRAKTKRECCSSKCQYAYDTIPVKCSECGGIFYLRKKEFLARERAHTTSHIFCGRFCFGRWQGKNHKPSHAPRKNRPFRIFKTEIVDYIPEDK